ncbi:MAG TPA: hypothetical protein VNI60_05715 [Pyrinomonadaceae bacterium]|nr:hypothetical protein [Pyrinomonadaceae bacterium]
MSVDFVIITALEEERDAVLSKLPNYKKLPPTEDDIRVYFNCELSFEYPDGTSGLYSIILLCLLDYGRVQALNATKDAINRWKPRYVLLVGIAGGIEENGVALGDIVVSDLAVDYELQNDSFYNTPSVLLCRVGDSIFQKHRKRRHLRRT